MLLKKIIDLLNCKVLTQNNLLIEDVQYCFAADLMSDVLRYARTGSLLLTGLTNNQVLQVAEILDLKGILFVRGKIPDNEIIKQADSRKLPLLSTDISMYDSCGILYNHNLKGGKSRLKDTNDAGNILHPVV